MGAHRVGVVGASGYTGAELLRLLASHPSMDVVVATSREFAGQDVSHVYPNVPLPLAFSELDDEALSALDLVFLALPHGASMSLGASLLGRGVAVVDLSADFRLKDAAAYPVWFGAEHTAPALLERWVYGIPELHREAVEGATAVANPGCYPTAALLGLAPLVAAGIIDPASITVTAASGVSGAGRSLNPGVHFSHVDANYKAYGLPAHKHTPEIEQELGLLAGTDVRITFVPHLVPMPRGLLATCIGARATDADPNDAADAFYADEPFVRVLRDRLPETKYTHGSNQCLLSYAIDERTDRVIALSAIDNLGKGAAGQAIQNANLMLGLDETAGLTRGGIYP